jgi:hypothetical protein
MSRESDSESEACSDSDTELRDIIDIMVWYRYQYLALALLFTAAVIHLDATLMLTSPCQPANQGAHSTPLMTDVKFDLSLAPRPIAQPASGRYDGCG